MNEKETGISYARLVEIATLLKDGLICDDEESAKEWFDNYHGFEDDDEDTFQDELIESIVYRAEYYEPKIDKWISIGERTSEEEASKLLDTPIAGNPKMRVQKYEKSGTRKVKYKELNESLDDEDFIYPLGSNTLTAYGANKRISNLKNDIRLLATCNSLEEVQAIKDNFIEYNVPNIIG